MVYSFPSNEKLWSKYTELRGRKPAERWRRLRSDRVLPRKPGGDGRGFCRRVGLNVITMTRSVRIQHAMNLKLRDEAAFFVPSIKTSRYRRTSAKTSNLPLTILSKKLNGHKPSEIPIGCNHLTMFIDVHGKLLLLRRRGLGVQLYRLHRRLWSLSRPTSAVLYAPRRPSDLARHQTRVPVWKAPSMLASKR